VPHYFQQGKFPVAAFVITKTVAPERAAAAEEYTTAPLLKVFLFFRHKS
jgi:hypothetical protein